MDERRHLHGMHNPDPGQYRPGQVQGEPRRAWQAPGYERSAPPHGPNFGPGWQYTHDPRFAYAEEYSSSYGYGWHHGHRSPHHHGGPHGNERIRLEREAAELRERLHYVERRLSQLASPRH